MRPSLRQARGVLPTLLLSLCPSAALAQSVWIVDDDGGAGVDFTSVRAAVAAATDGDLLLVRDGVYDGFTFAGKSLAIVADRGHHPIVSEVEVGDLLGGPVVGIANLAPGQEVILRGLEIGGAYFQSFDRTPYVTLANDAGEVWLEDVALTHGVSLFAGFTGIHATNCAAITVSRCDLRAQASDGVYGNGVDATGSNLTLWDCEVLAAAGIAGVFQPATPGGHGVELSGGSLFVSGGSLVGGAGGSTTTAPAGAEGGDGLHLGGGAIARVRDSLLVAGAGGAGTSGSGPAGQASEIVSGFLEPVSGARRTLELPSPVRPGVDLVEQTYTGLPGDFVYLLWSYTGQFPPFYLALEHGSFVIDLTTLDGVGVGAIGATGVLQTTAAVPVLSGVDFFHLACQASFFQPGGGFFLSAPSMLTLLAPGI